MNSKTTSFAVLLLSSLCAGLAPLEAATLRPRPLGFMRPRQVPLLADARSVGDLLPLELPQAQSASADRPADDETVQALRESGLTTAQVRQVAQNSKSWNQRLAKRDARAADDQDELAKKEKARRLKLPFGQR